MFFKENMYKFILILTFSFSMFNTYGGVRDEGERRWHLVYDQFFIDTKSFNIEPPLLFFWVKNKNYKKRRLTINCETFEEKERFEQRSTDWKPVISESKNYTLINQLCFLTGNKNFTKERFKVPSWAKQIIKNQNKLKLKNKALDENKSVDSVKKQSFIE